MFKLNTQRSFKCPVPMTLLDESGNELSGEFSALFRVMDKDEMAEKPTALLLDEVLLEVSDLELYRGNEQLEGEALFKAAKADPGVSAALVNAYWSNLVKKPQGKT